MHTLHTLYTLHDVGARFRQLREAAGKTQTEIAKHAGMRPEALSRFERGRGADFSLTKFLRLLGTLSLTIDFVKAPGRPTLTEILEERMRNANVGPDSR